MKRYAHCDLFLHVSSHKLEAYRKEMVKSVNYAISDLSENPFSYITN